ncbi:uncharacterized protein LOC135488300 [Lineus longissimus]|uniref:uncharacterized protein LOC135488300 n=1 Tax=Lineus longissimus TaxID=88925 RepID=UPI00315CAD32
MDKGCKGQGIHQGCKGQGMQWTRDTRDPKETKDDAADYRVMIVGDHQARFKGQGIHQGCKGQGIQGTPKSKKMMLQTTGSFKFQVTRQDGWTKDARDKGYTRDARDKGYKGQGTQGTPKRLKMMLQTTGSPGKMDGQRMQGTRDTPGM